MTKPQRVRGSITMGLEMWLATRNCLADSNWFF